MAEEGSVYEGLDKQLQTLLSLYSSDDLRADSKPFCSDFSKLVEEHASHWQVPLPQLRILELSLCYFARASTFFTSNCDHVLHTLSSLALSVFELLLFFDQKDFHEEPLKQFTVTFQECYSALARHQNVHLLQVERLVRGGGPWASSVLQAILSESSLPQSEVDGFISSELSVFFELRVRYLLSCEQRVSEAVALAKCCSLHPAAGQHSFFLQVYLTWLLKTSQHDRLHREVADLNSKDAIHIICSLECEEKDELLLALCRAFLSQQLRRGDMYYLCDLVFVWSKLHSRLKTSKHSLLEESHQLMLSATNVNSIFPFIRAILQELGEDGIQFCVELCANALQSCLPCDVITKSLIYKTLAGLLPNDLEVCRACALLVFFHERSVEAYKMVYLLYMHPDQEYHVDSSPIRNHVRFETLQVLKKDLQFDPEFWNLIALRTNCLKLMSDKVVSAALEEIMEDKWILKYCTKDSAFRSGTSVCHKGSLQASSKKRHHKEDTDASKRLKIGAGRTRLNRDHTVKKKSNQGSRSFRDESSKPLRRSFWQLDRLHDNGAFGSGELRRTTRHSEKNPPKRRIRKPRWLLEDSGTLEENSVPSKIRKHGLKHQKHQQSSIIKGTETDPIKNNAKHKPSVNSDLLARENSKHQKGISLDCVIPANPPQVILELSLPDNELMGTFNEETCNRQRGFPQVLFYKPTVKLPDALQPKIIHGKEVILRARDPAMFIQQLHCYARRQRGKGSGLNVQGSVSTITRSSVQGSPPKGSLRRRSEKSTAETKGGIATRTKVKETLQKVPQAQTPKAVSRKTSTGRELSEKSSVNMKDTDALRTSAGSEVKQAPNKLDKVQQGKTITSARELCEGSAVEMKVTIASQSPTSQGLDKVSKAHMVKDTSESTTSAEVLQTTATDDCPNTRAADRTLSQSEDVRNQKQELSSSQAENDKLSNTPERLKNLSNGIPDKDVMDMSPKLSKEHVLCERPTDQDSLNDISALTLVTEMVTELAPEKIARDLENQKPPAPDDTASKESKAGVKPKVPHKPHTTSSGSAQELGPSECTKDIDPDESEESDAVETEESRLEYCCTFCNKVFKGSHVVSHAMFHYRKDECMFCGTIFKDDLLAMMHLSNHIEKLKRLKDTSNNNTRENRVSETKDHSTPRSSAKAKTTNISPGHSGTGRLRRSDIGSKSISDPDSTPSGSRSLRSNDKPEDVSSRQEKKQNEGKHVKSKTPVHKINGHIGEKKKLGRPRKVIPDSQAKQDVSQERTSDGAEGPRLQEKRDVAVDSTTSAKEEKEISTEDKMKEKKSLQVQKTVTQQAVTEKQLKPQESLEKVCCPMDGCAWFRDLSKNRVALLYHALEDHYGEVKPLKLAFHVGNGKCSVCMRVLWSFEHFQHHIERHRLTPRYPCPHQGCPARFKTGMEMRRHARRHSPLQAACCLPGCSRLFICLWALNLHEREHYGANPTKADKDTNEQPVHPENKPKDEPAAVTLNDTVRLKAAHKLRRQTAHKLSTRTHVKAPPRTSVRASLSKQQIKESSETNESQALKNILNKDTPEDPSGPNLRLRQRLRKVSSLASHKTHKVISSSLFKHNIKVRHKLKKKQIKVNTKGPKRRGRPPKSKTAVHDENTTAGPKKESVEEQSAPEKHQKSADHFTSSTPAAETSNESTEFKAEESSQEDKTTDASVDGAKSKKSINKQINENHVKQKKILHKTSLNLSTATTSANKTQKSNDDKEKKVHTAKKRSNQNHSQTASSDSTRSKKHKNTNNDTKEDICLLKEPLKKPAESSSGVTQVESSANEEGKINVEEAKSTQTISDNSVPAVQANSLTDFTEAPSTSGAKTQAVATERSKKLQRLKEIIKKEKKNRTTSSDSGKTPKKQKDAKTKGDKKSNKDRQPSKDSRKTSSVRKTSKSISVEQPEEAKAAAERSPHAEEKSNVILEGSGSSVPAAAADSSSNETTSPAAVGEEKTQAAANTENSQKSHAVKNSDPSKAKKKAKVIDGIKKIVKRKSKDPSAPKKLKKSKTSQVQAPTEGNAEGTEKPVGQEEKVSAETPQSALLIPGYSRVTNGQEAREDAKAMQFKQTLAEYGKKPYMRAPPEAYLDERYITMPKRRKEMSPPPRNVSLEKVKVAATAQRQRCADCFATFNSNGELQSHLQLQSCSKLFGFDSDDEGNS
ncbi:uncharacterized protein LOC132959840 [Labrus mixtus]|uniref:uncharacterized protein LOC132959840 n=1 Tax=Labrus mixtus TaxID=508554 RepID=UPI0029C05E54|nr:uncharacterized protein LOC132959840 [Labrus mixtus]